MLYYSDDLAIAPSDQALSIDLALSLAVSGDYSNAIAVLRPLGVVPTRRRTSGRVWL